MNGTLNYTDWNGTLNYTEADWDDFDDDSFYNVTSFNTSLAATTLSSGLPDPVSWDALRVAMTTYTGTCFLLGFCGNLFALVTSHLYHSIDLDCVTIIFVRQLAIADLMQVGRREKGERKGE
eukprot:sb/3476007/